MIELVLEAERAMSFGLLDQAERLYRQASDADPRNAMAVVGLARVAIERGDEDAALAFGERALAIDPDNQAARRLVERLREIQAHRVPEAAMPEPEPAAPEPEPAAPESEPAPEPEPAAAEPEPPSPASPWRRFLRRLLGRR